jgi:hypothetical protein
MTEQAKDFVLAKSIPAKPDSSSRKVFEKPVLKEKPAAVAAPNPAPALKAADGKTEEWEWQEPRSKASEEAEKLEIKPGLSEDGILPTEDNTVPAAGAPEDDYVVYDSNEDEAAAYQRAEEEKSKVLPEEPQEAAAESDGEWEWEYEDEAEPPGENADPPSGEEDGEWEWEYEDEAGDGSVKP